MPLHEHRHARRLGERDASRASACAQYTSPPANSTGRSDAATSFATAWIAAGSGAAPRRAPASTAGISTRPGPNTSSGMSTNAGPRCGVCAAVHAASSSATIDSADVAVDARFTTGRDDRHVIELLQRTVAPTLLRRPAADHDHRRAVHPRRGHGAHTVGDAGSRGERRAPERRVTLAQPSAANVAVCS